MRNPQGVEVVVGTKVRFISQFPEVTGDKQPYGVVKKLGGDHAPDGPYAWVTWGYGGDIDNPSNGWYPIPEQEHDKLQVLEG